MLWKFLLNAFITKPMHHPSAVALLRLDVLGFLSSFTRPSQGLKGLIWALGALNDCPVSPGKWICWNYLEVPSVFIWRRQWHPTPVLLPGKSHGWRSLVGRSPWSHWELDMTEWVHFHFSLSRIGEGNGSPLQRSCLENPRDGGAWWAAVYGVAQSQTGLKWLSSSGSSGMFISLLLHGAKWSHFLPPP